MSAPTSDDVLRMAREAGAGVAVTMSSPPRIAAAEFRGESLERFAALVAAAEREACAKVCEGLADSYQKQNPFSNSEPLMRSCWERAANSIRARGRGCANCGDTGVHACIGHKPEPLTDEERAGLQKAVEAVFRDRPDYFRKPRSEYGGTCADLPSKIAVPNASDDVVGD